MGEVGWGLLVTTGKGTVGARIRGYTWPAGPQNTTRGICGKHILLIRGIRGSVLFWLIAGFSQTVYT